MRNKKNVVIIVMCIAVLIMAIGYAAFQTKLIINSSGSITTTWNIYFSNISSAATGSATNMITPSVTNTTATFQVGLSKPGDKMTYSITLKNGGDIAAIIRNINIESDGSYAIINSVSDIKIGDKLAGGATKVFKVTVEFDPAATSIPESAINTINLTMDVVQDTGEPITPTDPIIHYSTAVLFNPVTYEKCSAEDTDNSCYKWYVLNADNSNVDLILNRNLAIGTQNHGTAWNSSGGAAHANGPVTLLDHLHTAAFGWNKVLMRSDAYTSTSSSVPVANYTVNYSGIRARLANYEELKPYLVNNQLPSWLSTNLNGSVGVGYWLASSKVNTKMGYADAVFMDGTISSFPITSTNPVIGVRPVITIPRSKM